MKIFQQLEWIFSYESPRVIVAASRTSKYLFSILAGAIYWLTKLLTGIDLINLNNSPIDEFSRDFSWNTKYSHFWAVVVMLMCTRRGLMMWLPPTHKLDFFMVELSLRLDILMTVMCVHLFFRRNIEHCAWAAHTRLHDWMNGLFEAWSE